MGQEASTLVTSDTRPQRLTARSVEAVAKFIKDERPMKIVVMTGAGISTSAGIPDFRSPGTGLYSQLARLNLPHPEAIFDISYFRENPLPFYTLAHELYPGKYRPTISHSFVRLLSDKGLLFKLFTQNIDCLEREAGVPDEKIIEAHGSFVRQRCIDCKSLYPDDMMKLAIAEKEVPHCITPQCNGIVKPDIVFFGEPLPAEFHKERMKLPEADLCIVMGTSLSVQPFASLPGLCSEGVPRLLINKERVGSLGSRADDVLLLGDCDAGIRKLAKALGWLDELENLWRRTSPEESDQATEPTTKKTKDELLNEEITNLTAELEKTLQVSIDHEAWARKGLSQDQDSVLQNGEHLDRPEVANRQKLTGEGSSLQSTAEERAHTEASDIVKETELNHGVPHLPSKPST